MAAPRIVTIENATVDRLAADPELRAAFGACVDQPHVNPGGCPKCIQSAADAERYRRAKRCLGGLASVQRERLKEALGADQIRVVVDGQTFQY